MASVRIKPKDEIRAIVRALNKTAAQARTGVSRAILEHEIEWLAKR